jgi:hypothetical protein
MFSAPEAGFVPEIDEALIKAEVVQWIAIVEVAFVVVLHGVFL